MQVGYIQFQPYLCDLEKTIETLEPLVRSDVAADLVVLLELCNSGYKFVDYRMAYRSPEKSPTVYSLIFSAHVHETTASISHRASTNGTTSGYTTRP